MGDLQEVAFSLPGGELHWAWAGAPPVLYSSIHPLGGAAEQTGTYYYAPTALAMMGHPAQSFIVDGARSRCSTDIFWG